MCCFTKNVESVTDTNIFARLGSKGNQVLIYQMNFKSKEELAMVLPIPVKAGAGEKAVTFFDFSNMQGEGFDLGTGGWQESPKIAVAKVKCGYTHNMVRPEMHVHRNIIRGRMRNGDIIVQSKKI